MRIIEQGVIGDHNLFDEELVCIVTDDNEIIYMVKDILHQHISEWLVVLKKYTEGVEETSELPS